MGVEEQFYIFYPFLLLLIRRWLPGFLTGAVLIATLGSFALCLYFSRVEPTTAFYLLPTRAWELGMGGLVALNVVPRLASRQARNVAAFTGAALLIISFVEIRSDFAFPAPWAIMPCLGAALLIAYGRDAMTATVLSWAPVRGVGMISYSLYLWHWPIITLYRLEKGMSLTTGGKVVVLAMTFGAALFSYFMIERPFLRRYRTATNRPVLVAGGVAVAAMVGASLLMGSHAEAIVQHPAAVDRVGSYLNYRAMPQHRYQFRPGSCFIGEGEQYDFRRCLVLRSDRPNVIVMGDSHAAQHWRAIALRYPNVHVVQATASGCRPIIELSGQERCVSVMRTVFNDVVSRPGVTGAVLAGRWRKREIPSLVETVKLLRRRNLAVTVIGPTVEYRADMPRILARAMLRGDTADMAAQLPSQRIAMDGKLRPLIERAGGRYVSEVEVECPAGRCRLFDSDHGPYHFDYGHLTFAASRDVIQHLPDVAKQ
ncbi:acyltransferase family protein [Sphingomonas lacusdianchii]|uniref:acyltransferase family protein n=1 Tax=Sphingomonas lacusdianchii TaxID=2917992 RepID=UPI002412B50F|nr:acyltransferase family protein [Sphingomonas sp. JXJ CY 53]